MRKSHSDINEKKVILTLLAERSNLAPKVSFRVRNFKVAENERVLPSPDYEISFIPENL